MNNKQSKQAEAADFRQRIKDGKLIVLDCGKNGATLYDGKKRASLTHQELLDIPSNPKYKGYAIIVEDAHLGVPRGPTSLAQPFSKEQHLKFYKDCGENNIILRLFPQKSTPRAAAYANNIKSDETDPVSIYKMIQDFPRTALRKPPESFEPNNYTKVREEGYEHKRNLNDVLNHARAYVDSDNKRKGYLDPRDANTIWLKSRIEDIASRMSTTAKDAFQISYYKKGGINMNKTFNAPAQLYSILASLRGRVKIKDEKTGKEIEPYVSDKLNIRKSTGELPSWKFAKKHIFNFSPWHQKGGVARSNLMYHGARNYIVRKAKEEGLDLKAKFEQADGEERGKGRGNFTKKEDDSYLLHRKEYMESIKEVFSLFKNMI